MKKVFISYSLKPCAGQCAAPGAAPCGNLPTGLRDCRRVAGEKAFLDQAVRRLGGSFEVLWDRDVLFASDNWREKLYPCFGESHAAVILLTESAFHSHYVPLEVMVLMWRKLLEPNMLVIPVYFGDIDENRLREQSSPFYGMGLEDIQAVKHTGNDAGALDEIERALGAIADPLPLESIAMLNKLAKLIEGAQEGAMAAAAQALGAVLTEWGAPKALQLALVVLRRGLSASLNGLHKVDIGPDKFRKLLKLLAPCWVNPAAAEPIYRYRVTHQKPVLVIQAEKTKTAQDYVSRAWAHAWDEWGILWIPGLSEGFGVAGLKDQVLRAFSTKDVPPELAAEAWDGEAGEDLALSVLKSMGKDGQPVYVGVKHIEGVDPEELLKLQRDLPEITILFLSSQQPPQTPDFLETMPKLTAEMEKAATAKYMQAYKMLCAET